MNVHMFHPKGQIKTTWSEFESGACASLEFDDCRIDLFATGEDMRDRMERAINAFSHEINRNPFEREPVAQQIAAE